MEQYINKSALVAEIDSWRDGIKKGIFSIPLTGSDRAYATFEYEILGKVKDLLDTLEVKEIPETAHTECKKIKKLCEIQRYDKNGKVYSVMLPDTRLFMNKINDIIDAVDNIDLRLQITEQRIGE